VIRIVWEFRVPDTMAAAFEERYSSAGAWARLFEKAEGYEGTQLLRDAAEPGRYLTIDTWRDAPALEAFQREHAAAYQALDRECEGLTRSERCLGRFADLP
jgi:heme-degrading monooxygenase HmoA